MKKHWLSRIAKQYHFSAAHRLPKLHDSHPCFRLHGHNYVVEVEVRGETMPRNDFCNGLDFEDLDKHIKPLVDRLDHQYLNDIPGLESPTAERIAQWFLEEIDLALLYSVKVWETPKCWAQVINNSGYYQKAHVGD